MSTIEELTKNYVNHASSYDLGLWIIVGRVEDGNPGASKEEIKQIVLPIVGNLIKDGLTVASPRDGKLEDWPKMTKDTVLSRISTAWDQMEGNPSIEHSICWFYRKSPGPE